jgi:hypothetical protein
MALIKLNATQGLTGALPAISGANLTGLIDNGKVLQVVQATKNTEIGLGTSYADLMTLTITPSLASSKILVSITAGGMANTGNDIHFRLKRGASSVIWQSARYGFTTTGWSPAPWVNQYLDSPNTTSATAYTYSAKRDTSGDVRFTDLGSGSTNAGVMIAMEIGV